MCIRDSAAFIKKSNSKTQNLFSYKVDFTACIESPFDCVFDNTFINQYNLKTEISTYVSTSALSPKY